MVIVWFLAEGVIFIGGCREVSVNDSLEMVVN